MLERISKTTGTERKKRLLNSFIDQWRQAHKKLHPTDADTTVCNKTEFVANELFDIDLCVADDDI